MQVETSLDALLARDDLDAVAIATPARTHKAIALAALEAGKHVLVEKPMAPSRAEAVEMIVAAEQHGLTLMCDHTYCYTSVVQEIADLIARGDLGDILFIDSVRINLGLVQPDVDVLWDLAPHDLSILDYILPGGLAPSGCGCARRRSDRRGTGLRRLPDDAARQRCHRARPRQLAEPDQDPPDGDRR